MTSLERLQLESILYRVARTADWRRSLYTKFPDDKRNLHAAEKLEKLAWDDDDAEVTAETWAALTPHLDSSCFLEALSETSRDVEFRCRPANVDEFLKLVATKLAAITRH